MNDQAIEQVIQAKGLTAPRITPSDIEACIVGVFTFNPSDYDLGCGANIGTFDREKAKRHTICILTLANGFTIVGVNEGPVSAANFDRELGRQLAREKAVNQIWPLMGYELRSKLHAIETAIQPAPTTFQDRVRAEAAELDERITKLKSFTGTDTFGGLPVDEQERMHAQLAAMCDYSGCLSERIQAFNV